MGTSGGSPSAVLSAGGFTDYGLGAGGKFPAPGFSGASPTTPLTAGAWHHVGFVRDFAGAGASGAFYLDGAFNGKFASASLISYAGARDVSIGGIQNMTQSQTGFVGYLGQVWVLNFAASQDQMMLYFNEQVRG